MKAQTDVWLHGRSVALDFELTTEASEVAGKLGLIEAQLATLINQLRFNKNKYMEELRFFEYRAGRDYLGICIKAFHASVRDLLAKHGVQLKTTLQPLEDQIRDEPPGISWTDG